MFAGLKLCFVVCLFLASLDSSDAVYNVVVWAIQADELVGKFQCLQDAVEKGDAILQSRSTLTRPPFLTASTPWPAYPGTFFYNTVNYTKVDCDKYAGVCKYFSKRHMVDKKTLTWERIIATENEASNAQLGQYGNVSWYQFSDESTYRSSCKLDSANPAWNEERGGWPSHIVAGCTQHKRIVELWNSMNMAKSTICTDKQRHLQGQIGNVVRNIGVFLQNNDQPELTSDNQAGFRAEETYYSFFPLALGYPTLPELCSEIPLQCDVSNTGVELIMMARYQTSNWNAIVAASQMTQQFIIDHPKSNLHVTLARGRYDGSTFLNRGMYAGESACPSGVARVYEKCGGIDHNGPTCCEMGSMCVRKNEWYSGCQPIPLQRDEICGGENSVFANVSSTLHKCDSGLVCSKASAYLSTCQKE